MPSSYEDMPLSKYYYRCYDHDGQILHYWKHDNFDNAGHGVCRNLRKLTFPEFVDQIKHDFADCGFETQPLTTQQKIRIDNLRFIHDLVFKYGVKGSD